MGRVKVNGEVVTLFGMSIDPEKDIVLVDDVQVLVPATRTIMLNKPSGYITTCSDPQQRDTVMSLVPEIPGIHPVGRLDKETTGLLLLTNDGELTYSLTHPRHHIDKIYIACIKKLPTPGNIERLRKGIDIGDGDGITAPAKVRVIKNFGQDVELEIIIHEGKKRQVRRMLKAIGHPVLHLKRVQVGDLPLGDLAEGQWRDLTSVETDNLKKISNLEATS
jgi:23S rRNA pseudouridine2605 synthase